MLNAAIIVKVIGALIVLALVYVFWLSKYIDVNVDVKLVIRYGLLACLVLGGAYIIRREDMKR